MEGAMRKLCSFLASATLLASVLPAPAQACGFRRFRQNPAYYQAREALRQGKIFEAVDLYRKAARTKAQAAVWIAGAWHNLGMDLQAAGRYLEAANHFRSALRELPSHVPSVLGLASSLEQAGRPDEALREIEVALRSVRGATPVLSAQARLLIRLGDRGRARETFHEIARRGPLSELDQRLQKELGTEIELLAPGSLADR
jgi:tetratricopeptide (TPR) repeat protein